MIPKIFLLDDNGKPLGGKRDAVPWEYLFDQTFENVGAIIPNGYIAVDVDNHGDRDNVAALKRCFDMLRITPTLSYKTDRGWHYWFKNPHNIKGVSYVTKLGIPIEIKKPNMQITIKKHGKIRFHDFENTHIGEMPKCLLESDLPDLVGIMDGDGRHNALLKVHPDYKHVVNKMVFGKPLPQSEVDGMMPKHGFEPDVEYVINKKINR